MSEHKILINRTLNCIEVMKHSLTADDESSLFNDLLILRHIVPSLPKEVICQLLLELKPHSANDANQPNLPLNFERINQILSTVERPSRLLSDFLACAGVVKTPCNDV
jgi:hypothetical protein